MSVPCAVKHMSNKRAVVVTPGCEDVHQGGVHENEHRHRDGYGNEHGHGQVHASPVSANAVAACTSCSVYVWYSTSRGSISTPTPVVSVESASPADSRRATVAMPSPPLVSAILPVRRPALLLVGICSIELLDPREAPLQLPLSLPPAIATGPHPVVERQSIGCMSLLGGVVHPSRWPAFRDKVCACVSLHTLTLCRCAGLRLQPKPLHRHLCLYLHMRSSDVAGLTDLLLAQIILGCSLLRSLALLRLQVSSRVVWRCSVASAQAWQSSFLRRFAPPWSLLPVSVFSPSESANLLLTLRCAHSKRAANRLHGNISMPGGACEQLYMSGNGRLLEWNRWLARDCGLSTSWARAN